MFRSKIEKRSKFLADVDAYIIDHEKVSLEDLIQAMQGSRKPGVLVRYADMPDNQQIMLSECLGSTWNAMQALVGDRFLLMLDAFQGDDVQMPTVEQIEKRIIMSKIASEFKRLRADNDEDQSIDTVLEDMAETHKTSPKTIREILSLACVELQNANSEHAFSMD